MIIRGFHIKDWSCIGELKVDNLPPDGVVVLHGPNGTGKSSVVHALRSCLMDFKHSSTDKDLKRWLPGSGNPFVEVTFQTTGKTYRVAKEFKTTGKCRLETKSGNDWRLESDNPGQVHDRVLQLCGGLDSRRGLNRLLWLTQGEITLPDEKELKKETALTDRLRQVLGTLQTPIDSAFLSAIERRWESIFQVKSTKAKPKYKPTSEIEKCEQERTSAGARLVTCQAEFDAAETLLQRRKVIETSLGKAQSSMALAERARVDARNEYDRLKPQADARTGLEERYRLLSDEVNRLREQLSTRDSLANRLEELKRKTESARTKEQSAKADETAAEPANKAAVLRGAELKERQRNNLRALRELAAAKEAFAARTEQAKAEAEVEAAKTAQANLVRLKKTLETMPNPGTKLIKALQTLQEDLTVDRARLTAAAVAVRLEPERDQRAETVVDGATGAYTSAADLSVRHSAMFRLPGWGQVTIRRGSDEAGIDELEEQIRQKEKQLADRVAPYGIKWGADSIEQLYRLEADHTNVKKELAREEAEFTKRFPKDTAVLAGKIAELKSRVGTVSADVAPPDDGPARTEAEEIESAIQQNDAAIEQTSKALEKCKNTFHSARIERIQWESESGADERALIAMPAREEIESKLGEAESAKRMAATELESASPVSDLNAAKNRLDTAEKDVENLRRQISSSENELSQIKGEMISREGCYQHLSEATAAMERLDRQFATLKRDADAVDRLREIFVSTRAEMADAIVAPISARVGEWLRILGLRGAKSISFNEQFLPETIDTTSGELAFDHESTGTVEQLALMTRLALGGLLSRVDDPAVAVLDDPLTHSDAIRLRQMRGILRSASEGIGKFGPLQILVFTCHPDWFPEDADRTVNLADLIRRGSAS